jgi:hypothetical protein
MLITTGKTGVDISGLQIHIKMIHLAPFFDFGFGTVWDSHSPAPSPLV